MKIIFKLAINLVSFILDSIEIKEQNGDTHISLNISGLFKRVIYACVTPLFA